MAELFLLAEELSCSICLELFKEPVTTPCGHNFCRSCLDETWAVQGKPYRCPQCRAVSPSLPELRKNTVLCAVVDQYLQAELEQAPVADWTPPSPPEVPSPAIQVFCDHCLKAEAVKTCLVCMASFCPEHLRPHLESPAFQDHQLQLPVRNLLKRKCSRHNRLRDLFCPTHGECICHVCLVDHKTCSPVALSQASTDLQKTLRHKLTVMCSHIGGATRALEDVRARQQSLREATNKKMEQVRQEYTEMKILIEASEASATRKLKEEEKRVVNKFDSIYQILLKKKNEIQTLKEEIESNLVKRDEFEFLEKASKLQTVSTKPVYIPRVELDHELIKGVYQGALEVKNQLRQSLAQSQEKKPEEPISSDDSGDRGTQSTNKPSNPGKKSSQEKKTKKHSKLGSPLASSTDIGATAASASSSQTFIFGAPGQSVEMKSSLDDAAKTTTLPSAVTIKTKVLENFLAKTRSELLEYFVKVILDYNTAHYKVALTENYTTASVADAPQMYRPHPQRFMYCSQVLGLHCYKKGIHYWEVELQKNNFCGVGICYGTMDRQGPESRLGRNKASWCVEWFNNKISAWHNNTGKTLPPTKATRVGVLLNCDHGFVIFFAISDKIHMMYKYVVDFTEALYPAFWVFSAGATLSICSPK
ncbi:E3 ubiquitin/ISG15 ligase TRIM25 isoform X1 [Marmota marmota marmota]|uniref:RING-type E3 ubiquitin transferase n=1 Tax=Marmota marmota marmota TaxID=9994 RepID=A0A8C6A3A7_MARMA|nr:E3 ubiquitin/ISG15 ligase TRIM25 isoform X1 [Marmota marmota marmota]